MVERSSFNLNRLIPIALGSLLAVATTAPALSADNGWGGGSVLMSQGLLGQPVSALGAGAGSGTGTGSEAADGTASPAVHLPEKVLTEEQQNVILKQRCKTSMMFGALNELCVAMYADQVPYLSARSKEIWTAQLNTVYPPEYKPTYAEFFEAIARQTQSHLTYDSKAKSNWVLEPPAMPLPFTLTKAEGWKSEDHGLYVAYTPPGLKYGMDVYIYGRYSGLDEDQVKKMRNSVAMIVATMLNKQAKLEEMKEVTIDDCGALYFATTSPGNTEKIMRQWTFIKDGEAFVILSSIDKANEAKLLPEVEAMVQSFHVVEPAPKSLGL